MLTAPRALTLTLLAVASPALGQFRILGPASGSTATAVSAEGTAAAGYLTGNRAAGWRWNANAGRVDFGNDPGMPIITIAWGISADGSTVVGQAHNPGAPSRAYRYRGPGLMDIINPFGSYTDSVAYAANQDGSVIVGAAQDSTGTIGRAFRWTQQSGVQSLGVLRPGDVFSNAVAVSRDGDTIAGNSGALSSEGYVWTASTGMRMLPPLPGTPFGDTFVYGMNSAGTVILGTSGIDTRAVYWADGQVVDLGRFGDAAGTMAVGASDDGSVIVGWASFNNSPDRAAWVWTQASGMISLHQYLAMHGVAVPDGWNAFHCSGVSADGKTLCGVAAGFGRGVAFVATIPSCSVLPTFIAGAGLAARRRRR